VTSPITDFAGKVAVVTGGASGIGRAIGEALAEAGARVVLTDVESGALDATVDALRASTGGSVEGIVCDVSDHEAVQTLAAQVFATHGATHLLVNNAGVGAPSAKVWETTPNDWRWTHSVNVMGVAFGILAFVPRMLASGEPGYVVNTSSGDGAIAPMPMASVYASSKAAVATITECLAVQLAQEEGDYAASLFLPGGKGLLATGLWTADRNRPPELAREKPRSTPAMTIETLAEQARKGGYELPIQPLDELAQSLLDGVRAGTYCISLNLEDNVATLHDRAARLGRGEVPAELDHGGLLGAR
jgi:NAD(P)-dependent dehydrogenase (short-subunit alcohol dehydrogenase family)